ncbi:ABC transporter substrate-binding protein [Kitasatospora sp. NPDC101183]|uniref:ABC transporter substrate-binding protein n=1 Tax=Kitasatospora sp. NPDC101183 TaxID=3364100 RepID=UPI003804ED0A
MNAEIPDLVIGVFDEPATLDPHRAFDTGSRHPLVNVYDGLYRLSADRVIEPALAEALPVLEQRGAELWATIPVRQGVRFHDGSPLSLQDVVYSLRRMAITAVGPASLWSDALLGEPLSVLDPDSARAMIERIQATGDGLLLKLRRRFDPLAAFLVEWSLVMSRSWAVAAGGWDGERASAARFLDAGPCAIDHRTNGTGPYALAEWDHAGRTMRFERNESYWLDLARTPKSVVLRSEDDRFTRENDLTAGRNDFSVCQPESRDRLGELDGIVLEKQPGEWSITPLGFVNQKVAKDSSALGTGRFGPDGMPPDAFADLHLRRMLGHAFDHDRYLREVLDGEGLQHPVPFPLPAIPDGAPALVAFDLDRAREEFEQAWEGEAARRGIRVVMHTHAANVSRVRAAEIMADGLRRVHPKIVVETEALDFNELMHSLYAGSSPLTWLGWSADYPHPYAFAATMIDGRALLPEVLGICDPELSELLERAREATGENAAAGYRAIAGYCRERALFVAVPGKVSYLTYSDRWCGVRLKNEMGNVLDFTSFRLCDDVSGPVE